MAGRYGHALRMNGLTPNSDAQRTQRVAILFEQEQYARIVAMKATFKDPGSRYRVAYSYYAVGDVAAARVRLRALLNTPYSEEAAALIQAMGRDASKPANR